MAKGNKGQVEKKVAGKAVENQVQRTDNPIYRVVTFVRPGMRDARYGVTRSEGLVIISFEGFNLRMTCSQYYSILRRVEDKKYCVLKDGHEISELKEIRDHNRKIIEADMEISLNGATLDAEWIRDFNSRYPELSRGDVIDIISSFEITME